MVKSAYLVSVIYIDDVGGWKVPCGSVCKKAVVIPVSLVEVPTFQWLSRDRCHKFFLQWYAENCVGTKENFLKHVCLASGTRKCQVRIFPSVPASREETGSALWIIENNKAAISSPGSQTLSIGVTIHPISTLAVKDTSIETGVWEHQDSCWGHLRGWKLVDVGDLAPFSGHAQPLNLRVIWRLINMGSA